MSVELYPTVRDLEEKLASLQDPTLAERLQSANPDLFAVPPEPQILSSAAAREEISIFAAAWKRFGNAALAVTAAASIVAGYFLTPLAFHHQAASPAPAPVRYAIAAKARPPSHPAVQKRESVLRATVRRDEAEIARLRARLAAKAAAPAPIVVHYVAPVQPVAPAHHAAVHQIRPAVHHVAVVHHAVPAAHTLPAAAYPAAAPEQRPQVDTSTSAQTQAAAGPATDTASSTSTSASTTTSPSTNAGTPDGTKNPPPSTGRGGGGWDHIPAGIGGIILGRTIDPCTPQGGRIGTVLQAVAGQLLTHGGRF